MKCQICNNNYKVIIHSHLKKHNITTKEYEQKYGARFDSEYSNRQSLLLKGKINLGDKNPAKRLFVKEKIKNTVRKRWREGRYNKRINGMAGKIGKLHPNFKYENHANLYLAEHDYADFLKNFEDVSICRNCGQSDVKINVHHIDENRNNFLPSNLESLCVPCHSNYHYKSRKEMFLSVGKYFTFCAAHRLPYYNGKCSNWHGHEWKLLVSIRKRINNKTGMVIDFNDIKLIVTDHILNKLDHSNLNDYIENPTAENILVWIWEVLMFDAHLKGIEFLELQETSTSIARLDIQDMLSIYSNNIEDYVLFNGERRK